MDVAPSLIPRDSYGLLDGPGYTLPALADLVEYTVAELREGAVPNLVITGKGEDDNRAFIHPEAKLRSKLTVTLGSAATGFRLAIASNCTLRGHAGMTTRFGGSLPAG